MRAVWSFWTKPFKADKGRIWHEPKHHLYAWGLSLRLARPYFRSTQLITDTPGKRMLVDRLGLEFDEVSTALDALDAVDPAWWALGKLVAYSVQTGPFVHIDTDVFLWRPLPPPLLSAPVFAQCPERHSFAHEWCGPRQIEHAFARHGHALPVEWEWASSREMDWFREENCGMVGGNRVDFLRHFASSALALVLAPKHSAAWAELGDKSGYNMMVEQFYLAACVDYHRSHPESPYRGVNIRYLFPSWAEAYNPEAAARAGYTHLLGDAKTHPEVAARLERRISALDPTFLKHCQRVGAGR